MSGTGTLAGPLVVNGPGQVAPGDNSSGYFGGAGTLTVPSATLNGGAVLDVDLGASSDLLKVTGALTLNGGTLNVQSLGTLSAGTYEIMSYGSLTNPFNAGSLLIGNMPAGYLGSIFVPTGSSQIDLNVFAATVWSGAHGSAWDISTQNWTKSGSAATYANGNAVEFIDGASTGTVSIAGTVTPAIFEVSNGTLAYTFSGAGSISGSVTLTKEGSGTLAMNMAGNTYSGGTGLGSGVLQIGANSTVSGGVLSSGPLGTGA